MRKLVVAVAVAAVWLFVLGTSPAVVAAAISSWSTHHYSDGSYDIVYEWDDGHNEYLMIGADGETVEYYMITKTGNPNPEGDDDGGMSKQDVQGMADRLKLTGDGEEMSLEQTLDDTPLGKFLKQAVDEQSHSLVHVYRPSDLAKVSSPGGNSQAGFGDEEGLKKSGQAGGGMDKIVEDLKKELAAAGGGFDVEAGNMRQQVRLALQKEERGKSEFAEPEEGVVDTKALEPDAEEWVGPPGLINPATRRMNPAPTRRMPMPMPGAGAAPSPAPTRAVPTFR